MTNHSHGIREEAKLITLFIGTIWFINFADRILPLERLGLEKRTTPLLISLFVVALYGGTMLTAILPWQTGVSWEGYLFGGLTGAFIS